MYRRKILIVVITLMLLFTFISCNHSTSGPQDVIRKITIIGDYSLAGIPSEVKNGTVITFPEKIINGHSYTATIANRPYSAGEKYTVNSDIIINLLLNHEYTQWTNDGKSTHVRHCTVEGCSNIESGYHTIKNGSCTLCGYHSDLFTISDNLAEDSEKAMKAISSSETFNYVNVGKIKSKVSSIKLGEKTYKEEDTISIGESSPIKVFTIENGELKVIAPVLWFSMFDNEILKIENESFLLPEVDKPNLKIDETESKWSAGTNELTIQYDGSVVSTKYNDSDCQHYLILKFNDTNEETNFIYRVIYIYSDGTSKISYIKTKGEINLFPFGQSDASVSSDNLKTCILISAYSEIGYIETLLTFNNGKPDEERVNPANIENGETVKISKEDGVVYSIVTNFMSGYSTSKEYEGDDFKVEATVINDIPWSRSRNLSSAYSVINISKPYQDEYGNITWDGMYVYDNDRPEQKDMKEILNSEDIITGRDYDNGLLYIIDKNVSDNDLEMVNEILNCLYYDEDSLMEDNYLEKEQEMLKTKPSEKYLFPMKDSRGNNHRLFTIAIYDFNEEDIDTLGYFSSVPYNSQSSRNAYAAFYMNLSSIRKNYNESGAKAAAESFLKTFAHEYTHYLQVDRKHNTAYMETIDLAHFLEEGIADYISLKQNGLFEKEHGAYNEEQGYINMMFHNSKTYHPRCQEDQICNYGIGCMFWSYIEEKYQDYGGMDVVINLTRQDTDTLEAVERELKKPFNEVYEDFMLEIIAEALGVSEINGIKRDMKFPELYEVNRIYNEAITYNNDADKTDMNVNLGPMSFSIIRYHYKLPNKLTFASESADAKCYLVYSD